MVIKHTHTMVIKNIHISYTHTVVIKAYTYNGDKNEI